MTNPFPSVSVIITSYNYAPYLEECLQSVLRQDYPQNLIEIILVDDGSTDQTLEVLQKYKNRIRLIQQNNSGQAVAWNRAVQDATGSWIAFLDADDWWMPDKLSAVVKELSNQPEADAVLHYLLSVDKKNQIQAEIPEEAEKKRIEVLDYSLSYFLAGKLVFFPPTSGIILHRQLMHAVFPVPEEFRICADSYLHLKMPLYAKKIIMIPRALSFLRFHGHNAWMGKPLTEETLRRQITLYERLREYLAGEGQKLQEDIRNADQIYRSLICEAEIWRDRLRGNYAQALKKICIYPGFPFHPLGYHFLRKLFFLLLLAVPLNGYLKLRVWYRQSFLFKYFHQRLGQKA